jgi:hypothetical protein
MAGSLASQDSEMNGIAELLHLKMAGASAALIMLTGCFAWDAKCAGIMCGPCPPSLAITILGAPDGGVIPSALVALDGEAPQECSDIATLCEVHTDPGEHELTVCAPGYEPLTTTATVTAPRPDPEACCGACPSGETVVTLTANPLRADAGCGR